MTESQTIKPFTTLHKRLAIIFESYPNDVYLIVLKEEATEFEAHGLVDHIQALSKYRIVKAHYTEESIKDVFII